MSNPILDALEEVQKLNAEYVATNDARYEKMEKGQDVRAEEDNKRLGLIEVDLSKAIKERDTLITNQKNHLDRIEMLEALGDRPKGTPQEQIESQYKELFLEGIRTKFADTQVMGRMQDLMRKAREMKDVTIGTSAAGGFAVPKEIGAAIDKLILSQSEIASNVKNIQVGTSDYQELVSFNGAASGWVGETGTRSATGTPSLRNIKPTWGELYAYPQISEWSAQDIFFDVAGWLIGEVSDNMSVDLSTSLFSGDGSDQLTGMTNTAPVATGDNDSPLRAAAAYEFIGNSGSPVTELRSDDIIDLAYKLKAGYRSGSKWAMNSNTQGAVRKLKDTTGQYLWQPSLQLGQPDMLLGYPMFTWEDLGEADVANALPIAFGNWERGYLLTRRSEMMITVDQVTNPGYIRYYVRRRWGGMPKNNDAIKFLKNA